MPELPDVEGFKRYYARHAAGRRVESVAVPTRSIVRNTTAQVLGKALRGQKLERPTRRGKWMLAPAGDNLVLFHFGMTGFFVWTSRPEEEEPHRHDRLVLVLDGGELRYRNMRMLGGVWLAGNRDGVDRITGPLGPDADTLSREQLEEVLGSATGGLKGLLMNQRRVAGIGNELSDEILWRARLHPRRPTRSLDGREVGRLHRALRDVIATSNRHGRIPVKGRWLKSQRGEREPRCPRCRRRVERATVVGRTAYWCPRCQPAE